jgi:LysR family nitrogen assimilation transcriptional regulator
MDIRHFRYFVSIVECGSLSKAAEQLYITQPSLSLQIRTLESELKTQLLLRSSQGVKPTEAGKILYRHARAMLRQVENIHQEIKSGTRSEAGEVAVGLPTAVAAFLAHPLFNCVHTKFPGIHLHILETMSGYLAELLANGRLDMAVLFRQTPTRGVFVQPLFDEDLYVFGRLPKGDKTDACPLSQLDGVPMVLPSNSQALRLIIERSFTRAGLELNVVADIDSLPTRIAIAREGSACTLLSSSNALFLNLGKTDVSSFRRIVDPNIRRTVSLCWPTSLPPNSATIAVYRSIIELVRTLTSDKSRGMRLRPVNESAFEVAHSRYRFRL